MATGKNLLLDTELLKKTGVFALVSGELLLFIGGGYWLGTKLDRYWGTAPYVAAVLAMLGLVYSVWRILYLARQWMKRDS